MICTVCKYTPTELFAGFGQSCQTLEHMAKDFDLSDSVAHVNLCGFGKTVIQNALAGDVDHLVLVNCCDTMRRVYEVVRDCRGEKERSFTYLMDLPHSCGPCQVDALARELIKLKDSYANQMGCAFSLPACQAAFQRTLPLQGDYVGVLGVRVGAELQAMIEDAFQLPVRNLTCTGNRMLNMPAEALVTSDEEAFFHAYAQALLEQMPCRRMNDPYARRALFEDPNLKGIVYHCMKFCDFYGPEYALAAKELHVPMLRIESDFSLQSAEQLRTRIEAFAETLHAGRSSTAKHTQGDASMTKDEMAKSGRPVYVAGIDSGSTSTDVVILNGVGDIVATQIIPTGGGAEKSAEACLAAALDQAGMRREDVLNVVTTGYGRAYIAEGDDSVTEITCHAKGAHYLNPSVRTIIDIGGQDNKVIRIDDAGNVVNFAMNDKCAAGTGRFLEMMARALQISLEDMSVMGLEWSEDITISSMCSVFAESEVVSLVAQSKAVPDIVHGLNNSVASKISSLVRRVGAEESFMMTGGVAQNAGVVDAIERKLQTKLYISDKAQLCGALGAALFALE